ncbi:MAG TPA: peptidoglycan editing factor PgeF [Clostridia bacterium]
MGSFAGKNGLNLVKDGGLSYIQFEPLVRFGDMIKHCFTTRLGGVSQGEYDSLNLAFNKKDLRENVLKNYSLLSNAVGIDTDNMVFSNQVHENKVKKVGTSDQGKGIKIESDIKGYDGLVTNESKVALVTFYADCVPVLMLDPEKRVVAACHSGWRGTVKGISIVTAQKMQDEYGSSLEDIVAVIGPSIKSCCFEVGSEVYDEFKKAYPWCDSMCTKGDDGKWHIDLQSIIARYLVDSGLKSDNVHDLSVCTRCNKDVFFSHRGDNGKTGTMAGIIQLN